MPSNWFGDHFRTRPMVTSPTPEIIRNQSAQHGLRALSEPERHTQTWVSVATEAAASLQGDPSWWISPEDRPGGSPRGIALAPWGDLPMGPREEPLGGSPRGVARVSPRGMPQVIPRGLPLLGIPRGSPRGIPPGYTPGGPPGVPLGCTPGSPGSLAAALTSFFNHALTAFLVFDGDPGRTLPPQIGFKNNYSQTKRNPPHPIGNPSVVSTESF